MRPSGRPPEGGRYEVDHRDGDKFNNRASNLSWVSSSENRRRAAALGLVARGDRHRSSKLTAAVIPEIRARIAENRESLRTIAADFGVTSAAIGQIRSGRAWAWVR